AVGVDGRPRACHGRARAVDRVADVPAGDVEEVSCSEPRLLRAPGPQGTGAGPPRSRGPRHRGGSRSRTSPVPWLEDVEQLCLGRAGFGLEVVLPGHERRHRREDALDAASRLKAEERAAVPHQIELDVAAAAVELPIALTFAVRRRPALLDDG